MNKNQKMTLYALSFLCMILLTIVGLFFTGILKPIGADEPNSNQADTKQSVDLSTPESTVREFVKCFNEDDCEGMIDTLAIEQIGDNVDLAAMLEDYGQIQLHESYLPSEYRLYREYNKLRTKLDLLQQINYLRLSVICPEKYQKFLEYIPVNSRDGWETMIEDMNPDRMPKLKIVRFREPVIPEKSVEFNKKNNTKRMALFGADDFAEFAVLFQADEDHYAGSFQLFKYGNEWRLFYLNSFFFELPSSGALKKLNDKTEFEDL